MENTTNIFKRRSLNRDEAGLTLVEMVVAVVIFGLLTTLVFNLFQTSRETTKNVQAGSTSIAQAQTATSELAKKVRNATKAKISADGNRLDIENSDSTCTSWVFNGGKLYIQNGPKANDFSTSWLQRLPEASVPAGGRFFSGLTDGVAYTFISGSDIGSKKMEGQSYMRLPSSVKTSVCFGDAPVVTNPSPTPIPTPTPVPVTVYEIGYDLAGGSVSGNPTNYTTNTATFTLNNPTRSGYNFSGWTGTGLSSATSTVVVDSGSTGNRTYTATWTAIPAPTPTPTPTPTPPATGVNMEGTFVLDGSWGSGANAKINLKATANQPNNWKMTFTLPSGSSISWSNFQSCSNVGSTYTCTVPDWAAPTSAGATYSLGFGINGSAPTSLPITFAKR